MLTNSANSYIYRMKNELHKAALLGDKVKFETILDTNPNLFFERSAKETGSFSDNQRLGSTTVLHMALEGNESEDAKIFPEKYQLVEFILKHSQCKEIINITSDFHQSTLQLIADIADHQKATELAKLAILAGADINYQYSMDKGTALHNACWNKNVALVTLLIKNKADVNKLGSYYGATPLSCLCLKLIELQRRDNNYKEQADRINQLMLILINNDADLSMRDKNGKTFFDYIDNSHIERFCPTIQTLIHSSVKSTPTQIAKAKTIFDSVLPLSALAEDKNNQSPLINNMALLVELKRDRRRNNQSDYDCTVLDNYDQLDSFLSLSKWRYEEMGKSFQTHFIVRPRGGPSNHVANGQLSIDEKGQVTFFWVDSLGYEDWLTKTANNKIGTFILKHFPQATLYLSEKQIQHTQTGCHNFAMYLSERLSNAAITEKNIANDLEQIWTQNKKEASGFRLIPWEMCPAYTGIPRIIQSASAPETRIVNKLPQDQDSLNKKGENYEQAMRSRFKTEEGKTVNQTYRDKRLQFGHHLKAALEQLDDTTISQKQFSAFTDIVNRVPVSKLTKELAIHLYKRPKGIFKLSMPWLYRNKHLTRLQEQGNQGTLCGTLEELSEQVQSAYDALIADTSVFQEETLLYQYAAIKGCCALISKSLTEKDTIVSTESLSSSIAETEAAIAPATIMESNIEKLTSNNQSSQSIEPLSPKVQSEHCIAHTDNNTAPVKDKCSPSVSQNEAGTSVTQQGFFRKTLNSFWPSLKVISNSNVNDDDTLGIGTSSKNNPVRHR